MIIAISGNAGSGKSTAARNIAKKLNLKHYSSGDFMRQIAKERKVSLLELSKLAETDQTIDEDIDKRQIELGKKENNFVIDGRLAPYFIPRSIKIFIDCKDKERARRILGDHRKEEKSKDLEEMQKKIKQREKSEIKRYEEYYHYNPYHQEHYDLVIDSSKLQPKDVRDEIIEYLIKKNLVHLEDIS